MEKYYKQFENCRQNERPFCADSCPFHVEVVDFMEKIERKNYNAAYRTFRKAVGFPDITAALCPEYCAASCPRTNLDQAIQLNLLEKTCVAKAAKKDPTDYNLPFKKRKIAVIGAGISGLACALRLTSKKYDVTVFEKTGRIGGQLWELLPSEIFLEDINRQFKYEHYTLRLNTEIRCMKEIQDEGFETVYAATGKGGREFGAVRETGGHCVMDHGVAIFAGGGLTGKDPINALADGLYMARAIEVFLQTGKMEYPESEKQSKTVANPDKLHKVEAVIPSDNGLFTDEEAATEAGRCIRCQCDACKAYCDLCSFYKKWPLQMRDDIMTTVMSSESIVHKTPAIRLINTCTQCMLCDEVCPENIELGEMIKEARKRLHKQGKMPGAYHQFWLRDMDFSNSESAKLKRKAPKQSLCEYAFFPGCQMGAADPRYVIEPYKWLLSQKPNTGLLLRCCGIPASWAGNEDMHKKELRDLQMDWQQLGKPVLILACPSCSRHLAEYLPEIKTVSLYEILEQWSLGWEKKEQKQVYSVFDPCSARNVDLIGRAVRKLAEQAGISLEELPKGVKHGCCGYGGHVAIANPDFADYAAKACSTLSENPYITYCINCRDVFREEGKPVMHILDFLFHINKEEGKLPDVTERRRNRIELKNILLKEIWKENVKEHTEKCKIRLIIGSEIKEKMNKQKVLEEDLCNVIEFCEPLGRQIFNPEKGTYTCFRELGYITYWVEYRKAEEQYEILNVYTHRVKIELEMMWNGRKTDFDLR